MHTEILSPDQIAVLAGLKSLRRLRGFYLAGGTALALRHGHRRSIDFDWFREERIDERQLLRALEARFDRVEVLPSGEDTLYVRLLGVTASFFRLRYPLLDSVEDTPWGFGLASDHDMAAMKLEAIAGRGSRKDFVDLFVLSRSGLTIERVFELFERKYGTRRTERYHRLRALSYFDDAEREPMPEMLIDLDWADVRSFFEGEAARLLAAGVAR